MQRAALTPVPPSHCPRAAGGRSGGWEVGRTVGMMGLVVGMGAGPVGGTMCAAMQIIPASDLTEPLASTPAHIEAVRGPESLCPRGGRRAVPDQDAPRNGVPRSPWRLLLNSGSRGPRGGSLLDAVSYTEQDPPILERVGREPDGGHRHELHRHTPPAFAAV